MVRIIYGDVLLLIDFCMNFFVLYTTGIILKRRIKFVCIGGASVVGGIYSVAKLFIGSNDIFDCVISFSVGLLICYICFGEYRFLKTASVFYCISSLVGGIMFGLYYFLGSYHTEIYGYAFEYAYSHLPIWLFIVLAAVSMTISWVFAYMGRESNEKDEEVVIIEYGGKRIYINTLLDSGNLAKEPISGKYVVIISRKKAKELMDEDLYRAVLEGRTEMLLKKRFRLISVTGLEGKAKTHYGFMPERIYIKRGKKDIELDAYLVVCDTNFFGGCDGIAHPALFG